MVVHLFESFRITSETRQLQHFFPTLDTFFYYVEIQWIRGMPISIWNVYQRDDLLRTTKICEGWYSNWKHQLGNSHPNIWGVIMGLKKQERNQKVKLRKAERGEPPVPQRRKHRKFNSRVRRLKDALENNLIDVFAIGPK